MVKLSFLALDRPQNLVSDIITYVTLIIINGVLHHLWYLVSLSIQSHAVLYLFIGNLKFYQGKAFMLYNVRTLYSTFASTNWTLD